MTGDADMYTLKSCNTKENWNMMTSWHENAFHITGPCERNSQFNDEFPTQMTSSLKKVQ